jgi:FkbM family methyltransferase
MQDRSAFGRSAVLLARKVVLPFIMKYLPWKVRYYLFREAALNLGVATITCDGELGQFEGYVHDREIHAVYLATKTWAPEFQTLARDHLFAAGGGTLVDVGANIGFTSIPVAKARHPICHAFEPDPANYALLVRNIAANGVGAFVKPQNTAIMDSDGTFELERSADNMGDHRIRIGAAADGAYGELQRQVVKVVARRLDTCLADQTLAHPLVLKVDTQGAEARVFRGAVKTLRQVDVVFAEYWPYGLRRMGDRPSSIFEVILGFEYGGIARGIEPVKLGPTRELVDQLQNVIPVDGTSIESVDIVLSRTASL